MTTQAHGELIPSGGGETIPLIRNVLVLGRRESCDIPLNFPNISSMHCELRFKDGYWYIHDLNSTNGIKVNGMRVQQKLLHPGDEISIAKRRYTIQYTLLSTKRVDELDEDILSQSLLEKAGLARPKPRDGRKGKGFDPADFLLQDEDGE